MKETERFSLLFGKCKSHSSMEALCIDVLFASSFGSVLVLELSYDTCIIHSDTDCHGSVGPLA